MNEITFKNKVIDLDSKKINWEDMGVSEEIQKGLFVMAMNKPSLI